MTTFCKHASSVFAGTLLAQSIPIIGALVITRIFAPSDFGDFSTWLGLVSFISVVVTLRLETVLPIVDDGKARAHAVYIILITTLLVLILLVIFLIALNYIFGIWEFLPKNSLFLVLGPPAILFVALNQVWQTWAAVDGVYGKLNIMRLVQVLATVLIQIMAGLKYPNAISLILGFLLANCISFVVAAVMMPRFVSYSFFNFVKFREFFLRYKNFLFYALPADAINTAVSQLPLLVVFHRFGSEAAGYLALTMRVLGAPVGLVGKAVLDVFKRHAAQSIRESGNCRELYLNAFMVLAAASVVMVFCTIFFAEYIFLFAFGVEWSESGRMALWLLPMFALGLIASPLSYMSYLVEKPHIDLLWQVGLMIILVISLYSFSSCRLALIGYGASYAVMYLVYIFMSYRFSCGVYK
jgi:O-antigen/teichoic acid export membrane protein